jgi:hypothetical protein
MLDPQIIANLSQQSCVTVDFMGHGYCGHLNIVFTALGQRQSYSDYDYSKSDKLD